MLVSPVIFAIIYAMYFILYRDNMHSDWVYYPHFVWTLFTACCSSLTLKSQKSRWSQIHHFSFEYHLWHGIKQTNQKPNLFSYALPPNRVNVLGRGTAEKLGFWLVRLILCQKWHTSERWCDLNFCNLSVSLSLQTATNGSTNDKHEWKEVCFCYWSRKPIGFISMIIGSNLSHW